MQTGTILVVEDDAILAMDLEALLQDSGYQVMGPTATVKATLTLLRHSRPDIAVVDVNLPDGAVFPVADALAAAGIPFVMLTGHGREVLPSAHRHRPYMTKPFVPNKLLAAISSAILTRDPRRSPPA